MMRRPAAARDHAAVGRDMRRHDVRRNQRGFTLVEVLTAVAIIAGLVAIFFLGFKYVQRRAKADQTKVTLQSLRGMLTDYKVGGASMQRLDDLYPDSVNPLPAP